MFFKQAAFKEVVVCAGAEMETVILPLDLSPTFDSFVCGGDPAQFTTVVEVFHEWTAAIHMDLGSN